MRASDQKLASHILSSSSHHVIGGTIPRSGQLSERQGSTCREGPKTVPEVWRSSEILELNPYLSDISALPFRGDRGEMRGSTCLRAIFSMRFKWKCMLQSGDADPDFPCLGAKLRVCCGEFTGVSWAVYRQPVPVSERHYAFTAKKCLSLPPFDDGKFRRSTNISLNYNMTHNSSEYHVLPSVLAVPAAICWRHRHLSVQRQALLQNPLAVSSPAFLLSCPCCQWWQQQMILQRCMSLSLCPCLLILDHGSVYCQEGFVIILVEDFIPPVHVHKIIKVKY